MKTMYTFFHPATGLIFFSLLLLSCSRGFKTDLGTGLKMAYDGMGVEDSYLTANGAKLSSNDVQPGKEVVVVLEGITGLQMKDGAYTIHFETTVTDMQGNYLLQFSDTLVEQEVSVLRSYLTVADPMAAGQTYRWTSTFRDMNGTGKVQAAIDLDVTE